jgi:hypothetical protein
MIIFMENVIIAIKNTKYVNRTTKGEKGIFAVAIVIQAIVPKFYLKKNKMLMALGIVSKSGKGEVRQGLYGITIGATSIYRANYARYAGKRPRRTMTTMVNHWKLGGCALSITENGINPTTTRSLWRKRHERTNTNHRPGMRHTDRDREGVPCAVEAAAGNF